MKLLSKIPVKTFPVIFLFVLLPLCVQMTFVKTGLTSYAWFPDAEETSDFFLYYRSLLFQTLCGVMTLLLLISYFLKKRWCLPKSFLLLFLYGLLCLLSAFFSINPRFSFGGIMEHYESVWVLLGYMICIIYCYQCSDSVKYLPFLMAAVLTGIALEVTFGLSQLMGMDLLNTSFMKQLFIPDALASYRETLEFRFQEDTFRRVYMTLYNPNYAGSYCALFLPICISMIFYWRAGILKLLCGVLSLLLFLCLIFCGSKTAVLSLLLVLAVFILLLTRQSGKKAIRGLLLFSGVLFLIGSADFALGSHFYRYLKTSLDTSGEPYLLEQVQPSSHGVFFTYNHQTYLLSLEASSNLPCVTDSRQNPVALFKDPHQNLYLPQEETLDGLSFSSFEENEISYVQFTYQDIPWYFTNETENGCYSYVTIYGKQDEIRKADSIFPSGFDHFFTYRGYTWGRTIPLLKNTILLGTGPDTFILAFPQDDYLARSRQDTLFFNQLLTKPHNMYLQTGIQTGLCSLAALLAFYILYIKTFLNSLKKRKQAAFSPLQSLSVGLFLGIIGYLLTGVANDSTLCVAPLFFGILGIAFRLAQKS